MACRLLQVWMKGQDTRALASAFTSLSQRFRQKLFGVTVHLALCYFYTCFQCKTFGMKTDLRTELHTSLKWGAKLNNFALRIIEHLIVFVFQNSGFHRSTQLFCRIFGTLALALLHFLQFSEFLNSVIPVQKLQIKCAWAAFSAFKAQSVCLQYTLKTTTKTKKK